MRWRNGGERTGAAMCSEMAGERNNTAEINRERPCG